MMRFFLLLLLAAIGLVPCAHATDRTDLIVSLKTLEVLEQPLDSPIDVGVLVDSSSPDSIKDADVIEKILKSARFDSSGVVTFHPIRYDVAALDTIKNIRILFLARGVNSDYFEPISKLAQRLGIYTMSTDLECVMNHYCVLGVVSKPSVQVYYSKKAADASKIHFLQAFTMLAKQI